MRTSLNHWAAPSELTADDMNSIIRDNIIYEYPTFPCWVDVEFPTADSLSAFRKTVDRVRKRRNGEFDVKGIHTIKATVTDADYERIYALWQEGKPHQVDKSVQPPEKKPRQKGMHQR